MIKRETVRINTPGAAPKKETTSIGAPSPLQPPAAPAAPIPPSATRPLVPPPAPRPPSAPLPPSGLKPAVPPAAPPKPAGVAPVAPRTTTAFSEAKPVSMKAAPKKETARIQVAPTQKLQPQATVRLSAQPTQQLSAAPAPAIRTAPAPAAAVEGDTASDGVVSILSWIACVAAIGAAVLSYLAYSS